MHPLFGPVHPLVQLHVSGAIQLAPFSHVFVQTKFKTINKTQKEY